MLTAVMAAMALMLNPPVEEETTFAAADFNTTVYFDYGRLDLGSAGRLLVTEMGERARAAGYTRAKIVGHTDKAGPEDKNYHDGLQRAEAVAEVLSQAGFTRSELALGSAGETQPARKHEDERREPLNRRAVIEFLSP
ncbi:OmpA family protein [Parvularcula maris]|uniref:OmpA family protein n=1 Tax=Parvularcula maris TaxID=2965077 RepID=A0A9X2LAE9_9PROT|nr:OmpA family protein [Parvularcula maris]MCQ8185923.1 OmpA family protein [Parvularcula maris]